MLAPLPASREPANREPEAASALRDTGVLTAAKTEHSTFRVIRTHWPGSVLLVGVVFSIVFCLQMAFIERLADQRGFKDVKVFFLTYGPAAMALRVIFRRVPERIGRSRTLSGGLVLLAAGLLCLMGVQSQSGLVLPA